ncbi:hypothetical protein QUF70_10370 [Desulfobacterales bacterium HSG17]|nr:hypothetical protein [Desulfobacterales bacterium HSG17]
MNNIRIIITQILIFLLIINFSFAAYAADTDGDGYEDAFINADAYYGNAEDVTSSFGLIIYVDEKITDPKTFYTFELDTHGDPVFADVSTDVVWEKIDNNPDVTNYAGYNAWFAYVDYTPTSDLNTDGREPAIITATLINHSTSAEFTEDIPITIKGTNDAPVMDNSGYMEMESVAEDSVPNGQTVADILNSVEPLDPITDVDTGNEKGIAVIKVDDKNNGAWQYNAANGWMDFSNTISESNATVLAPDALIRFVPNPNYFTDPAIADSQSQEIKINFAFLAWDQTNGSVSGNTGINTVRSFDILPAPQDRWAFSRNSEIVSSVTKRNESSDLWPLRIGDVATAIRSDSTGNEWSMRWEVVGKEIINSQTYYKYQRWNYRNNNDLNEGYVRSTKDACYGYYANGLEHIAYRKAPVGTQWSYFRGQDEEYKYQVNEVVSIESVTVPLGFFEEAYVHRHYRCTELNGDICENQSEDWFEYVVPGLGIVKEVDYWTDNSPKIQNLVSITNRSAREALIDIYNSTDGLNWNDNTNWLGELGTECTWYGIYCEGKNYYLNLGNNNLKGTIPASIANITDMLRLNLEGNEMTGIIPTELSNLTNLKDLSLAYNQFTGEIPSSLGNLTNLENLELKGNQLTGEIPSSFGNLTKLYNLYLKDNQLTGNIPSELGNLSNLTLLWVNDNQLSGPIPPELLNLTNLTDNESDFRNNSLYTTDESLRNFLNQKQIDGDWESFQIPTDNKPPSAPLNLQPAHESIDADGILALGTKPFSDPDGDLHKQTQWMIKRTDRVFNTPDYDESFNKTATESNLTNHSLTNLAPGLKYTWKAGYTDSGSNQTSWSQEYSFKVGTSVTNAYPQVKQCSTAADFKMISITQWPDSPAAESVFAGNMGGNYDTNLHRIGSYNPLHQNGAYKEYGNNLEMEPGRACWVFARKGMNMNIKGVPVSTDHDIELELFYNPETGDGWNMIAPPNNADYLWDSIMILEYDDSGNIIFGPESLSKLADDNPYIDKRLWTWENGAYADNTQNMLRHNGYWVKVLKQNIFLKFPVSAQTNLSSTVAQIQTFKKAVKQITRKLFIPDTAIAYSGDSPPLPPSAGLFDTQPGKSESQVISIDSGSDDSGGGGGCFISVSCAGL